MAKNRRTFNEKAKAADTPSPKMTTFPLARMRPTQITAGLWEVELKRCLLRRYAEEDPAMLKKFLAKHPVRVVLGPNNTVYVVDRHHLGLAMLRENFQTAAVQIYGDLSTCSEADFWRTMEKKKFIHLNDENGNPQPLTALPKDLASMKDDPYRSLAAAVRNRGGYKKVKIPYAEFQWADYFRTIIPAALIAKGVDGCIETALAAACSDAAKGLPGYTGKPPKKAKPCQP